MVEEGRRWYLQVYCRGPRQAALMWAQSRARQAEGFRDAHSLQSFPSKVLPYENLRPPLSIFPVLKVEML